MSYKFTVLSIYILFNIYRDVPYQISEFLAVPFSRYQGGGGGRGVGTRYSVFITELRRRVFCTLLDI